jgi:hypothetical protein
MNNMGINVTHEYFNLPIFIITVVPTQKASAARSWFATPNIGQIVDMLPE